MDIDPGVLALLGLLYRLLPLFLSSWCPLVAILLPQGAIRPQSMWRRLGFIFTPESPPNPFFKFLIMYSNTVALDSLPPHLAYLLGPSSTFPFPSVYEVLSTLWTLGISTQ